jgi:hypothetical protein
MLCILRSEVSGYNHVIQQFERNRKVSASSTTANQPNKKLTGQNEGPQLPKSTAPIRTMTIFSGPTNLTRNATRATFQAVCHRVLST